MSRAPRPLPIERMAGGAARYVTVDGDVLDHICWRHYGQEWTVTEVVLSANPGLADHGAGLPAGIVIHLPAFATPATPVRARRRLFD